MTTRLEAAYGDLLSGQTQIEILIPHEKQLEERSIVEAAYYEAIVFLELTQTNQRKTNQSTSN